jgi:uncharacterized protein
MIFSRDYIGYLARRTVKHLIDAKMITTSDLKAVEAALTDGLIEELSLEDRINEEVRVILEAYSEEMRKSGAQYAEMFKKVKTELARSTRRSMRISRDKLNKLAHTVADTLAEIDEVGFLEDRNTIRQEARKILETLLTEEARIDTAARLKIANQRKIIMEGSQEWEILYRKYYNDEVRKLGI